MREPKTVEIRVKRPFYLTKANELEHWLEEQARAGLLLRRIRGFTYTFEQCSPRPVYFFLIAPDKGTNSEAFLLREPELRDAARVPAEWLPIITPLPIVLAMAEDDGSAHMAEQMAYYRRYRNYRLARRQAASAGLCFTAAVVFDLLLFLQNGPRGALLGLTYAVPLATLGIHFLATLRRLRKPSQPHPLQKPRRPGY